MVGTLLYSVRCMKSDETSLNYVRLLNLRLCIKRNNPPKSQNGSKSTERESRLCSIRNHVLPRHQRLIFFYY